MKKPKQNQQAAYNETLYEIIKICLRIDIIAHTFYKSLSQTAHNQELKDFWLDISNEEKTHIDFWRKTLIFAKDGMLPQIFNEPEEIKKEIQDAAENIRKSLADKNIGKNVISDFMAAFKVEFYGLHPGLAPLFNIMKLVSDEVNPEDMYDKHILKFLNMFSKYSSSKDNDVSVIGEALLRLWKDNRILSQQCYTDELTTLLNRRGFFKIIIPMLELARRNKTMIALMITDIDHFKQINDNFGHQAGDRILAEMHKIFRKTFRASDLVCRYGGDEFIMFCPEIKEGGGKVIAEKLKKAVSKIKMQGAKATLSIGVIETIPDIKNDIENELENFIKKADELLYKVKESGRNNVICKRI